MASSTHGSYQPALSLVLSTSGQATAEPECSYRLPLTAFHQMPVASHRALTPTFTKLCFTPVRALGRELQSCSPGLPLPGESLSHCPGTCAGTAASCPGGTGCSSRGTGRVSWGGGDGVKLALRCQGRASALRVRAGEGRKLAPALPVRCPPQRGRWGQEASAPGCTAGSRPARSLTGAVWVTEWVRTPNVLTEIQVSMSKCFSVCCIFLKVIFTSCGGSTREKGATAFARHPTKADCQGAEPSLHAQLKAVMALCFGRCFVTLALGLMIPKFSSASTYGCVDVRDAFIFK